MTALLVYAGWVTVAVIFGVWSCPRERWPSDAV